jgi:aminoglycoside 3-N-acetyltransferase
VVTKQDIKSGLLQLGLGPGSILVVHSSLKSFGQVEGGAETVIAALQETVTRSGLVIMPTHSLCLIGRPGAGPYDPATSEATTGAIPETFRQQSDVLRSLHPTHSDAAWGDRAAKLLADHERRGPVGEDSPLHRAAQWGGGVLFLGVGHGANTTLHLAEVLASMPYITIPFRRAWGDVAVVRRSDGGVDHVPMVNGERPGCSGGFVRIEPALVERRLTRETRIGQSRVRYTPSMPMIDVAMEMMRRNPAVFLCDPPCEHCDAAREAIAARRKP